MHSPATISIWFSAQRTVATPSRRNHNRNSGPIWPEICKNHEMIALAVGGTENHVHILFHLPPKLALAKAVALLKANSSKWMGEQGIEFSWQEGYGSFSVSSSNLDQVKRYIQNQESHHSKTSFEDEFREILRKHGVEYDPKFVLG